jgi:flagellar M-ring protein FliF
MYTSKLSTEAKARLKAKKKLYEDIKQNVESRPEEAAELLSAWVAEDLTREAAEDPIGASRLPA